MSDSEALIDQSVSGEPTTEIDSSSLDMFIVFRLGSEVYGIPVEHVKEVVPLPKLVKLPQPPKFVLGAINVRGNVFAVIDTGAKINGTSVAETGRHLVVLDYEGARAALLSEGIPQAKSLDAAKIETNSKIIGSNDQSYISGVLKNTDEFIVMLSIERFLASI